MATTLNRNPQRTQARGGPPPRTTKPGASKLKPSHRDDVLARYAQTAVDEDTLHRRATQSSGQYDSFLAADIKFFRAQVGDNAVRILPRTYDPDEAAEKYPRLAEAGKIDKHFSFTIYVHGNIGTDNAQYLCREKMLGEHCSVCDEYRRYKADGLVDEAREINASQKHIMWIIDRSDMESGPKVWVVSTKIDKEIASRCRSKRTGKVMDVTNPVNGYDVLFVREGQKLNTQYLGWDIDREPSPLADDDDLAREWLTKIEDNKLIDILNFYEDDYVAGVLAGGQAQPEEEEEAEEQQEQTRGRSARGNGRSSNGSSRSLRQQAEEEEEANEEEEEEEVAEEDEQTDEEAGEEGEEEEAQEEEEAEPEEEVEEEEEAPPPRRTGKPAHQTKPASKPATRDVAQAKTQARAQISRLQQNRRK
jgi:hypothetical protein